MRRLLAAFVSTLALSAGCDGLDVAPKEVGEACTRDYQCATGYCPAGACAVRPVATDAAVDAAVDAAADAPTGG